MKNRLFKGNADFFFGIAVIVFAVTGYMVTVTTIKDHTSSLMPKLIFAFMGIMGLGMSVSSVRTRMKGYEDATKVSPSEITGGILLPGAFLIGAYILIDFLGFYVAEFILIVALMYLQEMVTNGKIVFRTRRLAIVLAFATCAIVVMYLIFKLVFKLPTPIGIFNF